MAIPANDEVDSPQLSAEHARVAQELLEIYENDLDQLNLIADNADYATLTEAAYGGLPALSLAIERGWIPFRDFAIDNPNVGTTVAKLFLTQDGRAALAFRGTVKDHVLDFEDWKTNVVGSLSTDADDVAQITTAREIAKDVIRTHPDVVLVGHSLGGRMAKAARLVTGNKALVFNSAPLGNDDLRQAISEPVTDALPLLMFRSPDDPASALRHVAKPEQLAESLPGASTEIVVANVDPNEDQHAIGVLAKAMQDVRTARDEGWLEAYRAANPKAQPAASNQVSAASSGANTQGSDTTTEPEANKLFVESALLYRDAADSSDAEKLHAYKAISKNLNKIVADYPDSAIAKRIVDGGSLGVINLSELSRLLGEPVLSRFVGEKNNRDGSLEAVPSEPLSRLETRLSSLENKLIECKALDDATSRLSCYDRISTPRKNIDLTNDIIDPIIPLTTYTDPNLHRSFHLEPISECKFKRYWIENPSKTSIYTNVQKRVTAFIVDVSNIGEIVYNPAWEMGEIEMLRGNSIHKIVENHHNGKIEPVQEEQLRSMFVGGLQPTFYEEDLDDFVDLLRLWKEYCQQ